MGYTYKVLYPVGGHKAGQTVTSEDLGNLNTAALVAGGFLEKGQAEKEPCPSCLERNVRGAKNKQYTPKQLGEHYSKDHPGLQPPAGEEE